MEDGVGKINYSMTSIFATNSILLAMMPPGHLGPELIPGRMIAGIQDIQKVDADLKKIAFHGHLQHSHQDSLNFGYHASLEGEG